MSDKVSVPTTKVSITEEQLDQLVQRASVPNLASLFQAGKDAGLIQPVTVYGETA